MIREGSTSTGGVTRTLDAWDHPFEIVCDGDDVRVISAGPDGALGTHDDVE